MNVMEDYFSGSTGNSEHDMDGREALLDSSLPPLFGAFDKSIEEGLINPVLLLIDCEDTIGGPIAREWEGGDAVDAAILSNAMVERDRKSDEQATTVLIKTVSFLDGRQELSRWFPYLSEAFTEGPAAEGFYVVVISFGGAGVFTVSMSARPE